jgi:pimeloyl-ACP methyl ester carboxylesterase
VAAQVVGQAPGEVAGLVLLTPFDRMASAAQAQVGTWLGPVGILYPVGWFLSETYDSVKALSRYRNPLVVISGGQDTLTTAAAGRRLAEQAGENGRFWVQEENGHWANITPVPQCRELFAFATGVPVKEVEP